MPELPEVETIVRQLKSKLVGNVVTKVEVIDPKVVDSKICSLSPFKIIQIERKGKSIVFTLNNQKALFIQLRMTGHFHYQNNGKEEAYKKYLAGMFHLSKSSFFTYNTIRRFGSVKLMNNKQLDAVLTKMGIEPLETDAQTFIQTLQRYANSNLKNKLLDQRVIVGIGNIYAQEALYLAGIHPHKMVCQVSSKKLSLLHAHLQKILKLAIDRKGTTIQNFSHLAGSGQNQNYLTVYHQSKCPKNHNIKKIVISGRGTYYCPKCQR